MIDVDLPPPSLSLSLSIYYISIVIRILQPFPSNPALIGIQTMGATASIQRPGLKYISKESALSQGYSTNTITFVTEQLEKKKDGIKEFDKIGCKVLSSAYSRILSKIKMEKRKLI
jgi:hypothetical protein